ncbi:MAG: hypothetical protein AAF571_00405 [Verrucomicrobiota bacterium]
MLRYLFIIYLCCALLGQEGRAANYGQLRYHMISSYEVGQYSEALQWARKALNRAEQQYGKNSEEVYYLYLDMAAIYSHLDNWKQAAAYQQKGLKPIPISSSSGHAWFGEEYSSLAYWALLAGDREWSIRSYQTALDYWNKVKSKQASIEIGRISNWLASFALEDQENDKALKIALSGLEHYRKALGIHHERYANSCVTIGRILMQQREFERADGYFEKAIIRQEGSENDFSRSPLSSLQYRAINLVLAQRPEEAAQWFRIFFKEFNTRGDGSPRVLINTTNDLADAYFKSGAPRSAYLFIGEVLEQHLESWSELEGEAHADLLGLLIQHAYAADRIEKWEEAYQGYTKVIEFADNSDAAFDEVRFEAMAFMAYVQIKRGELDSAQEILDQAAEMLQEFTNPTDEQRGIIPAVQASIYYEREQWSESYPEAVRALDYLRSDFAESDLVMELVFIRSIIALELQREINQEMLQDMQAAVLRSRNAEIAEDQEVAMLQNIFQSLSETYRWQQLPWWKKPRVWIFGYPEDEELVVEAGEEQP